MADQDGGEGSILRPDVEVAKVGATLRVKLDLDGPRQEIAQFKQDLAASVRDLGNITARGFDAIRQQYERSDPLAPYLFDLKRILDLQEQIGRVRPPAMGARSGGVVADPLAQARQVNDLAMQGLRDQAAFERRMAQDRKDAAAEERRLRREAMQAEADAQRRQLQQQQQQFVSGLAVRGQQAPTTQATGGLEVTKRSIAQVEAEMSRLRSVMNAVEREWAQGTRTTREQDNAWIGASRTLRELQGHLALLNREQGRYQKEAEQSEGKTRAWARAMGQVQGAISGSLGNFGRVSTRQLIGSSFLGNFFSEAAFAGLRATLEVLEGIARTSVTSAANLETVINGLRQFTKDGEQAKNLLSDLTKLSFQTPFSLEQILEGSRRLLAMGLDAEKVTDTMRTLGAATAAVGGNQEKFNRIVLAVAQIGSKARGSSQDLRQLMEAGLPIADILREKLHLTAEEIQNIGRTAYTGKEILAAITEGLDERFGAGLILAMDTLQGKFRNFHDILLILAAQLGAPINLEFRDALAQLGDMLQDPATMSAAEALGEIFKSIAGSLREMVLGDSSQFFVFVRELPAALADAEGRVESLALRLSDLFGKGPALADANDRILEELREEARLKAVAGGREAKITVDIAAEVGEVRADLAKARVNVENADQLDLSSFSDILTEEQEQELAAKLSAGGLRALREMLSALDDAATPEGTAGRSMAHIAAQLRENFLLELSKLGDAPSVEQIQAATERLAQSLTIPGEFGSSDADQRIITLAQSYLELGAQQDNLANIQDRLKTQQADATRASRDEQAAIDSKTASLKVLTDTRAADSEVARAAIEDLRDSIDTIQDAVQAGDAEFDRRIKAGERHVESFRGSIAAFIGSIEAEHAAAAKTLDDVQARATRNAAAFEAVIRRSADVAGELRDTRAEREDEYREKIDESTDAEKRHTLAVREVERSQREQLRQQDELIDRIEARYEGELRIRNLAVDEQDRVLRAAQSQQNLRDLEFVRQIAAARASGDTERVKQLQAEREQARINFRESQEVAEAEATVRRDQAQATRDRMDAEAAASRQTREELQRNGQRNLDTLRAQGDQLAQNRAKLEEERDAALKADDRRIKLAENLTKLLQGTQARTSELDKADTERASTREKSTAKLLADQQVIADRYGKMADASVQQVRDEREASAATQRTIIGGLEAQVAVLERREKAAERAHKALVGPLQDEIDQLVQAHKANDGIRDADIERTRSQEAETAKRVKFLDSEIARIRELQKFEAELGESRKNRDSASGVGSAETLASPSERELIEGMLRGLSLAERDRVEMDLAAARKRFAAGGEVDATIFNPIITKLEQLIQAAGLSTRISREAVAAFIRPQETVLPLITVPTEVRRFMALMENGEFAGARSLVAQPGFVDELVRSMVGTDQFSGSGAILGRLEKIMGSLEQVAPGLRDSLTAALRARGFTLDDVAGKAQITAPTPEAEEEARNINAQQVQLQTNTVTLQAQQAILDGRSVEAIATDILYPLLGGFNSADFFGVKRGALHEVLSPDNGTILQDRHRDVALIELRELLRTIEGRTALLDSINSAEPGVWDLILDRLQADDELRRQIDELKQNGTGNAVSLTPDQIANAVGPAIFGPRGERFGPDNRQVLNLIGGPGPLNPLFTQSADTVRGSLLEVLSDPVKREGLIRSIREHRLEWQALMQVLDRTAGGQEFEADRQLRDLMNQLQSAPSSELSQPIVGAFNDIINAAQGVAQQVADNLARINSDEVRGKVLGDVRAGVVAPYTVAMADIGIVSDVTPGVLGPKGLGRLASPETIQRISEIGAGAGESLVAGLRGATEGDAVQPNLQDTGKRLSGYVTGGFVEQSNLDAPITMRVYGKRLGEAVDSDESVQDTFAAVGQSIARVIAENATKGVSDAVSRLTADDAGIVQPPRMGKANTGGPGTGGRFINPVRGSQITSGFDEPREWGKHGGLDLNLPGDDLGAPILAAADGIINRIRDDGDKGLGRHVEITHAGGYRTRYGHLMDFAKGLKIGQQVRQGQLIGYLGSTGNSTGPHLHYEEIAPSGKKVDPRGHTDIAGRFNGDTGGEGDVQSPFAAQRTNADTSRRDAIQFVSDLAEEIEESGGDLRVVLDAVFSGATELAADKLAGFSAFAVEQMRTAFEAIRTVIETLGSGGLAQLKSIATDLGFTGTPETNAIREEMRRGHPGMAVLEALGNVPDRSALLSLISFLQEHADDPAFSQLFDTLRNASEDDSLFTLLGRILIPANDSAFAPLLDLLQRLGPEVQQLISAPALKDLLGDKAGTLRTGELLNLLQHTKNSAGFADVFRQQLLNGLPTDLTIGGLADQFLPTDADSRRLLKFLIEQFGKDFRLDELRKQVLDDKGQLVEPNFQTAPLTRDPAARDAARRIRETALANQFITDTQGNRKVDPAVTSVLAALQRSEAKTLEEFLQSPDIASILLDDSPLGRLIRTLQQVAAANPEIPLADLRGFLFGGEGFESTNVVDAVNSLGERIDTTNAILLGANDAESIAIWRALLHEWEEMAPALVDNTAATAEAAKATADNTEATAANTDPSTLPAGAGAAPGGAAGVPGAPDTRTPEQRAVDEAKAELGRAQANVEALQEALEQAQNSNDPRRIALIAKQLREAEERRDAAARQVGEAEKKAGAKGEPLSSEEQTHLRERLEYTIDKYREQVEAARARGDKQAEDEAARRMKQAEAQLDRLNRDTVEGAAGDVQSAADQVVADWVKNKDAHRKVTDGIIDDMVAERRARQDLVDSIVAQTARLLALGGGLPPTGGSRSGDVGGDVGGGREISGVPVEQHFHFNNTVNDSYNPHRTAAQIANTQVQQARRLGEKGGLKVRGMLMPDGSIR